MARALLLIGLAGCNALFGIEETRLIDAPPPGEAGPDALRLVVPPDGATTCGAPPDFSTWVAEPGSIPPLIAGRRVTGLGFYASGGAEHVFVTREDASGDLGIWDNDLQGGEVALAALNPPSAGVAKEPSPTPDGAHLWFRQEAFAPGTYFGSRVDGWIKQMTTFGLIDVLTADPSAVGFHDGTARMIAHVQDATRNAFVELSSSDGLAWTELDTVHPTVTGTPLPLGAYLSPDGCLAVLSIQAGAFYEIRAFARDAAGNFSGPGTTLDTTGYGCCPSRPAMTTDLTSLWFIATDGSLVRMHP